MTKTENFAQVEVVSTDELREWLAANHGQTESVWLVRYKKHVAEKYVSSQQLLDELICFGWIDGVARKVDDDRTMQLISPRRVQHWAQTYKDRASKLIQQGRMHAAGLRAIEVSKEQGLWDYMEDVDTLTKPDDFTDALAARPGATANFDAFGDSSKRFTLRWIKIAKTAETRARRIAQAADLASENKKIPGL